jgi:ribosome modulation factor
MARPKGSKNKPKDPAGSQENPRKTVDTNVSEALALSHLRKIVAAEKKKDEAVNALRTVRKAAKADGVDLKTMDAVRHLAKLQEFEVAAHFNSIGLYARWLSLPIGAQMPLFEVEEITEETVAAKAFDRGKHAGKLGEGAQANPYSLSTPAFDSWEQGWREGQDALLAGVGQLQPEHATAQ